VRWDISAPVGGRGDRWFQPVVLLVLSQVKPVMTNRSLLFFWTRWTTLDDEMDDECFVIVFQGNIRDTEGVV
jgi:hypothetical protein